MIFRRISLGFLSILAIDSLDRVESGGRGEVKSPPPLDLLPPEEENCKESPSAKHDQGV